MGEWLNWYIHFMKYYLAVKKRKEKKVMMHATRDETAEIMSEKSQS